MAHRKSAFVLGLLLIVVLLLSACGSGGSDKASYFDGAVLVEYHLAPGLGSDPDELTIQFNEKGTYHVSFTPETGDPADFTKVITDVPRTFVVKGKGDDLYPNGQTFPNEITISITKDGGKPESHDFAPCRGC